MFPRIVKILFLFVKKIDFIIIKKIKILLLILLTC